MLSGTKEPRKFGDVIRAFLSSAKFSGYAATTKDLWGRELDYCIRYGLADVPIDEIRPKKVQEYLDGWHDKPGKQAAALTAIKAVEKFGVVRDLLPRSICLGVETGAPAGGHIPWSDRQLELAETHGRGDLARVVTLAAQTGQRQSDLIRMGWADIETYGGRLGINVTQQKTGRQVWVPVTEGLGKALDGWERLPGPILRRMERGKWTAKPWTIKELHNAWDYEILHNDALRELRDAGLVLHGLRGFACVELCRAGCTTKQVSDLVGMSEGMVGRYTRLSVQKENALAAVLQLEGWRDDARRRSK